MKNLDDAGLWWESRHAKLQDYEVPEPGPDSFLQIEDCKPDESNQDDGQNITATEVRNQLNLSKLKRPTAQIIVSLIDTLFPMIAVLLLKEVDKGNIKLDEDERETLIEAWSEFLKEKSFEMSPGVILMVSILTIYGSKLAIVLSDKKQSSSQLNDLKLKYELLEQELKEVKQCDVKLN